MTWGTMEIVYQFDQETGLYLDERTDRENMWTIRETKVEDNWRNYPTIYTEECQITRLERKYLNIDIIFTYVRRGEY